MEAMRANCGGDYLRLCAGMKPGGPEVKACFKRNRQNLRRDARRPSPPTSGPVPDRPAKPTTNRPRQRKRVSRKTRGRCAPARGRVPGHPLRPNECPMTGSPDVDHGGMGDENTMLTRLNRAFLRVFPAILLVVVGLLAALFRGRGGSRGGATPLAPVPARQPAPPVRRRGAVIALFALLVGGGLILALVGGDGVLWRLGSLLPSSNGEGGRPVAALSRPEVDASTGNPLEAVAPDGPVIERPPGEPGVAMAPGATDPGAPSFDTVRVEPNGELVVAGRTTPNGAVELLVDGKPTARTVADVNGHFAIVPPALPAGNSEVGLRATDAKGIVRQSRGQRRGGGRAIARCRAVGCPDIARQSDRGVVATGFVTDDDPLRSRGRVHSTDDGGHRIPDPATVRRSCSERWRLERHRRRRCGPV